MLADLHDFFEILQKLGELGYRFVAGDVFDIFKIVLSIVATVYFGRRYVKQHLRRLLNQVVDEISAKDRTDRAAVKAVTSRALEKAKGRSRSSITFDVRSTFETAARYIAQKEPHYAEEILEKETVLAEAAALLCEKQAQNARARAATAQLQIGLLRRGANDTVGGLAAFKKMLDVNPDDVDGLRFSGQELEAQGRLGEAREHYHRLEQISLGSDEKILLGESLRSLARVNDSFKDAITLLDQCMSIEKGIHHDIGVAYTWKAIGDIRGGVGHWAISEDAYDNALKIFEVLGHKEAHGETQTAKAQMIRARMSSRTQADANG